MEAAEFTLGRPQSGDGRLPMGLKSRRARRPGRSYKKSKTAPAGYGSVMVTRPLLCTDWCRGLPFSPIRSLLFEGALARCRLVQQRVK
jgi:hypothetical protein